MEYKKNNKLLKKRNIPLDYLCKLADFYNVSVDYLLYRTEKKTS